MGFKTILTKELHKVFRDKKMIFSMFILPVLLMGGMFSLMFSLSSKQAAEVDSHTSIVYVYNAPDEVKDVFSNYDVVEISYMDGTSLTDEVKDKIKNAEIDLAVVIPDGFIETVSKDTDELPQIKTFYNPSENNSSEARSRVVGTILENYRLSLVEKRFGTVAKATVFAIDNDNSEMIIQDNQKAAGKVIGNLLPYMISVMIFGGAMGLGIDSIAGEKERGTMASLLISPVKRTDIIRGKIVGLGIVSLLSSAVYVAAMALVMITGKQSSGMGAALSQYSISFSAEQIIQFAVLTLGVAFLYISIICLVSLLCKNIKEAQGFIMPIYLLTMVAGMITMFAGSPKTYSYFIPLYNTAFAFQGILTGTITMTQYLAAAGITYLCTFLVVIIMSKIIKSERIMLNA